MRPANVMRHADEAHRAAATRDLHGKVEAFLIADGLDHGKCAALR